MFNAAKDIKLLKNFFQVRRIDPRGGNGEIELRYRLNSDLVKTCLFN